MIFDTVLLRALKRGGGGGSYSYFPARISTKSDRPSSQIISPKYTCIAQIVAAIPIFCCFALMNG